MAQVDEPTNADAAITSSDVVYHAEVERICASAAFQRAPVMRRLLRFLVAETFAGRGDNLKAYGVAVDGLGKDSGFDPQSDSYPRVQVGRLRRMIAEFYEHAGDGPDGIRVAIPNGSYKVHWLIGTLTSPCPDTISPELPSPVPIPLYRRPAVAFATAAVAILLLVTAWAIVDRSKGTPGRPPAVAVQTASLAPSPVMDIAPVDAVDGADPLLAERIDRVLGDALHRSWSLSVRPLATRGKGSTRPASDYRLTGTLVGAERKLLYLTLSNSRDGTQFWSQRLEMADVGSLREALSPTIATIMSPFGVIGARERNILSGDFSPGFPCMMRYTEYYTANAVELQAPVHRCLKETLTRDPGYSPALSAEIVMRFRDATQQPENSETIRREALPLARQAIDANPHSAEAAMAMALAAYANGMCELGRANALRALERNPFDSLAYAQTGLFMYQCGDKDYEETLKRAWLLDPSLPAFMAMPILVSMGNRGEGEAALRFALSLPMGQEYRKPAYDVTLAVAYAAAGDRAMARTKWQSAARAVNAAPDAAPDAVLQKIVLTPQLADRMVRYLRDRGVFG